MDFFNLNVGLLGHVDSGKTSLAKCLSVTSSTACFDKNPQSQERGITIDLGFSSFVLPSPQSLIEEGSPPNIQFTLVDCPGHASLIKTIIGGVQIIDLMVLVIDVTKGIQTQTAECLVIGEITKKPLVVVLNKIDLLEESKRSSAIEKMKKKISCVLSKTCFQNVQIIPIAASPGQEENQENALGIDEFKKCLQDLAFIPARHSDLPLLFAVDHCFTIRGKGTILTGTVLQGSIKVNDVLEIPVLQQTKKVKSIQVFKKDVHSVNEGDRAGICVTQFDPKLLERGLVCQPGYVSPIYAAVIRVNKVEYYKFSISSKNKYHMTVGYETVIGQITLFRGPCDFREDECYEYAETFNEEDNCFYFALIEFEKPVVAPDNSLVIVSKLDMDIHTKSCRIAFYSNLLLSFKEKEYKTLRLPKLKIFKTKEKLGVVDRVVNASEVIVSSIFKKETNMQAILGGSTLRGEFSTGESAVIECSFGQKGKVKVRIPEGLKEETLALLAQSKKGISPRDLVQFKLKFIRFIYDPEKKMVQL